MAYRGSPEDTEDTAAKMRPKFPQKHPLSSKLTNGNETGGGSNVDNDSLLLLNHLGEHHLGELGECDNVDVDELINQGIIELVQKLGVRVAGPDVVHLRPSSQARCYWTRSKERRQERPTRMAMSSWFSSVSIFLKRAALGIEKSASMVLVCTFPLPASLTFASALRSHRKKKKERKGKERERERKRKPKRKGKERKGKGVREVKRKREERRK